MTPFRTTVLMQVLNFGFSLLIGAVGMSLWIDFDLPLVAIPEILWTIPLVIAAGVLYAAWQVKALADGKRSKVSRLTAARIAILCQACTRGGIFLAGIMCGIWLVMSTMDAAFLNEQASRVLWTSLSSILLGISGWVGEWWCSIDDDDDDPAAAAQGA